MTEELKTLLQSMIDISSESYATGNHTVSFAETADIKAYKRGATFLIPFIKLLIEQRQMAYMMSHELTIEEVEEHFNNELIEFLRGDK